MVEIKALACELPVRCGLPLAHWSLNELRREVMEHGVVAQISGTTLWRWLSQDEYARTGAWAYIAAWDVHRAKLFGRCERKTGIAPFDRLVAQVMREEPYRSAHRVFLITDNGSSHRGRRAANRLRAKWPNILLVHTPLHASWLNQIEVYFSIVQRKVLNPNDFSTPAVLKSTLIRFQERYEKSAKPFEWTFTRRDLHDLLVKLRAKSDRLVA
jgi:transposase